MTGGTVLPTGFGAFAVLTVVAVLLGLALLVLRARGHRLRGPLAAFAATALLYLLLVLAEALHDRSEAAMALLRAADAWSLAWVPAAALIWWAASRR